MGVLKEPQLAKALYTLPGNLLRGFEQICVQFVNDTKGIVGFAGKFQEKPKKKTSKPTKLRAVLCRF